MSGVDLSPWLQSAQLELRRQIANADMQQQQQLRMDAQKAAEVSRKLTDRDFAEGVRRFETGRQDQGAARAENIGLRRQERAEERKLADRDFAESMRRYEAGTERQTKLDDAALAKDAKKAAEAAESEQVLGFQNRVRVVIPETVRNLRAAEPNLSPEEIRDRMIAEAQSPDVSPEEKKILLDEIDQWYNTNSRLETTKQARDEKKQRQIEQDAAKKQEKSDIAESRAVTRYNADPFVRVNVPRATQIAKDITVKKASLASIEAQAAAGNSFAKQGVAGKRAEIAELQAEYDRIIDNLKSLREDYIKKAQEEGQPDAPAPQASAKAQGADLRAPKYTGA